MKVKPELATACICGGNFIYLAGPGRSRRICVMCLNQQTGVNICVDLAQSDDPPEDECECCMSTIGQGWELNEHGGKVCAECVAFLEFADGRNLISDSILEQQEKLDFEDIQCEYFDLSSDNVPF